MSDEARRLRANRKLEGKPCGWCQTPFAMGDDAVVCADDQAEHHAKCWDEKGGCSVKGCLNAPLKRLDVAPPGFPPVPPQPGFGMPPQPGYGMPPQPGYGMMPYGPPQAPFNPYLAYPPPPMQWAPPVVTPPSGPTIGSIGPVAQSGPMMVQSGSMAAQSGPTPAPAAPRPAPATPSDPSAFDSSDEHPSATPIEPIPVRPPQAPVRPVIRPGFKLCFGCGNQVLLETQICDFCNVILTPDGVYRGPTINAPGSVAALVYGIIGLFPCTAVVFGVLALVKSREAKSAIAFNPRYDGAGLATAGMVLGIIDIVIGGIFWLARLLG